MVLQFILFLMLNSSHMYFFNWYIQNWFIGNRCRLGGNENWENSAFKQHVFKGLRNFFFRLKQHLRHTITVFRNGSSVFNYIKRFGWSRIKRTQLISQITSIRIFISFRYINRIVGICEHFCQLGLKEMSFNENLLSFLFNVT